MAKNFRMPENIQFGTAFLKMHFPLLFKHFSGSGKSFKNFWQRFACINISRASCELIFYASESWDRWLFNAYRFILQLAILRHKMAKNFRIPESIQFDHAFLEVRVLLCFKHFSWSGKTFKNFWQRLVCIDISRASCELIFDALESWQRWLSNAYR